jgi:hypothetical protein
MKKLFVLLFVAVIAVSANAVTVDLLPNGGFETHGDDGYGREMPTDGYGLWTDGGNWGNIPDTQIVTTDAHTGLASFQVDTGTGYSDVALTYELGQLDVGYYHVGGFFKGGNGIIGVDMFSTDWSSYYWGGSTATGVNADWTYAGFDFEVTDATVQFNFIIKGFTGTDSFLVDDVQAVTDVVPEPMTLGLLGLGGLFIRRRKKA